MSLALPKIVYPSGGGATLNFIRQPIEVSAFEYEEVRHDNLSSAGVRESVSERIDQFYTFTMPWQTIGADINAWATFMAYALQGGPFDYYPDATINVSYVYLLDDTNWTAAYRSLGLYSFKFRMRLSVGWP